MTMRVIQNPQTPRFFFFFFKTTISKSCNILFSYYEKTEVTGPQSTQIITFFMVR